MDYNSFKILEEYQQKDSRIKIFRHAENKKQGAARNKGLEVATGEHIWFVDSDDYIDTKACQILYDAIENFKIDMLCFSALRFSDTGEKRQFIYDKYCHQGVQINKIYHPKTNWRELRFSNLNVVPWAYITKKSVIQNFRFREGVWHEDTDFTPILLSSVDSFCFIPYSAYFRRINPSSTTQTDLSQKRLEDLINMIESLDKFMQENKTDKQNFLCEFLIAQINHVYELCNSNDSIKPNNFRTLLNLKAKHQQPKYSLKRFIRKTLKKLFGDF